MPDIERALSRLASDAAARATSPRCATALGETGVAARRAARSAPGLRAAAANCWPTPSAASASTASLVERLGRALGADLPLFARDGGFIAAGYRPNSTSCANCATTAGA